MLAVASTAPRQGVNLIKENRAVGESKVFKVKEGAGGGGVLKRSFRRGDGAFTANGRGKREERTEKDSKKNSLNFRARADHIHIDANRFLQSLLPVFRETPCNVAVMPTL